MHKVSSERANDKLGKYPNQSEKYYRLKQKSIWMAPRLKTPQIEAKDDLFWKIDKLDIDIL